ncbi:MAG TPA: rhodanese-like domain-containing protein [Pyrinomonadaceae bacterium]|nr:rhodanese-like domain-containing protein [Pyrinomonadaceae bacterium]
MKAFFIGIGLLALVLGGCTQAPTRKVDAPPISAKSGISEMAPAQVQTGTAAAYSQFVDVRTPEEYAAGHAYRAVNIPLDVLSEKLGRLEKNEPVYIICRTDNRSRQAAKILADAGYGQVVVVTGGTDAWQAAGLPMEK